MRISHAIVSAALGASVWLGAGAARADGYFVTVTGPNGRLGPRTAGLTFQDTLSSAHSVYGAAAVSASYKVTLPWGALTEPLYRAMFTPQQGLNVFFELTHPDDKGVEQVFLTIQVTNVRIDAISASLASASTAVDVSLISSTAPVIAAPPTSSAKQIAKNGQNSLVSTRAEQLRAPIALSAINMAALLKASPGIMNVNDANATFPSSFPTEVAGATAGVHVTGLTLEATRPVSSSSGQAGGIQIRKIVLTKAPGVATASLQQALAKSTVLNGVTIDLVEKPAGGSPVVRSEIKLADVTVLNDSTQISGGTSSEQVTLAFRKIDIRDAASGQAATYSTGP